MIPGDSRSVCKLHECHLTEALNLDVMSWFASKWIEFKEAAISRSAADWGRLCHLDQGKGNAQMTPGRTIPSALQTATFWPGVQNGLSIMESPTLRFKRGDHAAEVIRPI